MKTLKQLIQQWRNTTQANTDHLSYLKKQHDICYHRIELRLEMSAMLLSGMDTEDKVRMAEKYQELIDTLNSELFWLDTLYDLNISNQ